MLRNEGWHPAEYLVLRRFLKALGMEPTQGAHSLAFVQCATVFHAQQPSWEQPGSLSADEWERKFDPDKIMGGSVLRFAVSEVSVHRWQILFLWARGEADIMAEGKEEERGNPITGWMPGQAKAGHSRAASHTSLWGSPPIYTRTVEFYPALRREKGWHVLVNRRNRRTAPGEMARPGVTDLISHLNLLIKEIILHECAIPFIYGDVVYHSCTAVRSDFDWCSLDHVFRGRWRYCTATAFR
ncbi:uncharacterized protein LOC124100258 isoform X3 [Marmota monax]|uniref:uncharacterized protein LOC124100258 isoform X3 n=1 Tax=Marmota monax TaxID=9995 RepID=UPI001EB04332|nr:uncharacterized protein LOC124100258 isoform X3 [Marmota monax]